jgi:Zn-dependent peptidase ImmA (M78 family)
MIALCFDVNSEIIANSFIRNYLPDATYPLNLTHVACAIQVKYDIDVIIEECNWAPREVTAQLVCSDWVAYILVNALHPINKRRFGICHEFGHLLLDHSKGNPFPGSSEPDEEKDEANSFAAALLMPSAIVSNLVNRHRSCVTYLIKKMTECFGVSTEAASRRLVESESICGLIALVDPAYGRLNWEYHSPSITLDQEYFREFLVQYFRRPTKSEDNLDIMGYPFIIDSKRIWGKYLVTCVPIRNNKQSGNLYFSYSG